MSQGEDTRARTSLILLLAFWIATLGLHVLLTDLAWWLVVCLVVTAVLGAPAAIRAWAAWRGAPPIAAIGALLMMLTLFFAPSTAFLAVIPTWETFGRFGALIGEAVTSINHQSVPADPNTAIVFLLCAGVGAMAVLADLLAISAERPALAGVPLLVILAVPAITGSGLTDLVIFLLVAAMYLWLLQRRGRVQQLRFSLALGAGMLAATLALPVLLPAVAESPSAGGRGGGFAAGINPVVNLGDDLRRGAIQTALTYTTDSGLGNYLRLVSLQNFSGDGWTPDKVSIDRDNTTTKFGPPSGLSGDVDSTVDRTHVTVDQLDSPWLPVPYPSVKITGLDGDWFWDEGCADRRQPRPIQLGRGLHRRQPRAGADARPTHDGGDERSPGLERYLQLPEAMPEVIASTARKVASSAASNYEKALALQEFFRNGDFEYSESAPVQQGFDGSGMEVIAKFLEVKQGYCIHFASAMTVMARSIGIPARMAVGFLPGVLTTNRDEGRNVFRVTTHELHTWPELFFEGVGWVRFEPTVSRGDVPDYAIQGSPGVPSPPPPAATDPAPPTTAPAGPAGSWRSRTGCSGRVDDGSGCRRHRRRLAGRARRRTADSRPAAHPRHDPCRAAYPVSAAVVAGLRHGHRRLERGAAQRRGPGPVAVGHANAAGDRQEPRGRSTHRSGRSTGPGAARRRDSVVRPTGRIHADPGHDHRRGRGCAAVHCAIARQLQHPHPPPRRAGAALDLGPAARAVQSSGLNAITGRPLVGCGSTIACTPYTSRMSSGVRICAVGPARITRPRRSTIRWSLAAAARPRSCRAASTLTPERASELNSRSVASCALMSR